MSKGFTQSEIWEDLYLVCDILSIFVMEMLRLKPQDTSAKGHLQSNIKQIWPVFPLKVHVTIYLL